MNEEWEIFPKCNGGTWDGKNHMGEKVRRRKKRRKKKSVQPRWKDGNGNGYM